MKKLLAVVLVVVAVAYYLGYDLSDLMPSLPTSNDRPARVRRAAGPVEQTPNATPAPASNATTPIAKIPDGSLSNRWQSEPSPSPKKP